MRFFRKCTQEDAIYGSQENIDVTTTIKSSSLDIFPIRHWTLLQSVFRFGQAKIFNSSQNQNVHSKEQTGQPENNISKNEIQQLSGRQILSNTSTTTTTTTTTTTSSCSPLDPSLSHILQSLYTNHIIVDASHCQNLIQLAKFVIFFLYFIILRPLLFGYEKIQFLDSSFIDNLSVSRSNKNLAVKTFVTTSSQRDNAFDIKKRSELSELSEQVSADNWVIRDNDETVPEIIVKSMKCDVSAVRTDWTEIENSQQFSDIANSCIICPDNFLPSRSVPLIADTVPKRDREYFLNFVICYYSKLKSRFNNDSILNLCDKLRRYYKSLLDSVVFKEFNHNATTFSGIGSSGGSSSTDTGTGCAAGNSREFKYGIDYNFNSKQCFYKLLAHLKCKCKFATSFLLNYSDELRTKVYYSESCRSVYHLRKYFYEISTKFSCEYNSISCLLKSLVKYSKQNTKRHRSNCGLTVRLLNMMFLLILLACMPHIAASFHHNIKYSMNVIKTKYGSLRGVVVRSNPTVEAFLGVPYASPPVGSLRFMPPVTPSTWRTIRLADRFSAVCPQAVPVPPNGPEALLEVPRGRLAQLRRLLPLLANQSEDCLYLNLYVPRTSYPSSATSFSGDSTGTGPGVGTATMDGRNPDKKHPDDNFADHGKTALPTIVYIHGESYEWNSGNPYDGSVLAAHGHIIVVTINFRLGILGFLKTGGKGSAQGNFGLMDLVAGLHWLRENLPAFGGDPDSITIMGHGTGAALANILVVSPVASDLVHRAILLSGSALSPWAIQKDPLFVKRRVAEQTGCHGDMLEDDLAPCLRTKPISELLAVKIDSPRFLPGFAPFIDGTVIVNLSNGEAGPLILPAGSAIASTAGIELADFPTRELIFGLTSIESYLDLSAQDLEFGFNETRRDRILRTYVRNVYHYHLNEIYAALKNEYTDWERPVRNPMGSRDASLEFLSDGHTAAPLIRLGYMHSLRGGKSYFLHFRHQSGERDFPQRAGSVRGEDVPFCLGLPISALFPYNYTKQDIKMSKLLIQYISNFAQTGNPNEMPTASVDISRIVHSKSAFLESMSLTSSSSSGISAAAAAAAAAKSVSSSHDGTGIVVVSADLAKSSASPVSSSSLVKNVNDHYLTQMSSTSVLNPSISSASSSSPSLSSSSSSSSFSSMSSSSSISLLTSGHGSSSGGGFLIDESSSTSSRTSVKLKLKRHAISPVSFRVKRKTVKNSSRKYSKGNKMFHRKKYPARPNGSSLEESISIAADQEDNGDDNVHIKHLIEVSKESSDEDEDEEDNNNNNNDDDDDDEDDDEINEEDEFSERNEDDVGRHTVISKKEEEDDHHHHAKEDAEKFDRFDDTTSIARLPFWDTYDAINQLYLELGNKVEIRNHYRGHKLSMWLSLIPQLHSPGDLSELPVRHHHFLEENAQYYDGIIRPQIMQRPSLPKANIQQPPRPRPTTTTSLKIDPAGKHVGVGVGVQATTTECPPNTTVVPTIAATRPQNHQQNGSGPGAIISGPGSGIGMPNKHGNNNLLRRLATTQYQSYSTALMVTIAVGCFLLLLNILIFAGIYYQREKRANDAKKKEELKEAERCGSPSLEKIAVRNSGCSGGKTSRKPSLQSLTGFNINASFGEYSCYDEKLQCKEGHLLADICSVELPLKEFKCSASPVLSRTGSLRRSGNPHNTTSIHLKYGPAFHTPQSTPHKHHCPEKSSESTNAGVVTYQQYHKQIQQAKEHGVNTNLSTSLSSSSAVDHCNQSTQSEQPTVQDVGTSVDEASVSWATDKDTNLSVDIFNENNLSSEIPEPPPPPKSNVPYQGGILRQPGPPTTPGSNKKRVQIQEISV